MQTLRWDLFCRVIDNFGDIGVCWRLAADLGARGAQVRLWVDDASALRWLAPIGAPGVHVMGWPEVGAAGAANTANADVEPGEVVIEAFGCELPEAFAARMARAPRAPVWINLEYLSAEAFVERAHRLPSPQAGGSRKWFFYPGFTRRTGGLIRELDLAARQREFDARAWRAAHGVTAKAGERVVSLFCYEPAALPALIEQFAQPAERPTLLLATAGTAARQVAGLLGPSLQRGALRAVCLPALTQRDYDHLLWSCDLNFVRGEDSFVRAQWAGRPFVWQIYPQHDAVHLAKLDAYLARFLAGADAGLAADLRRFWQAWNGAEPELPVLPDATAWREQCHAWRDSLIAQTDLATQLLGFVAETR